MSMIEVDTSTQRIEPEEITQHIVIRSFTQEIVIHPDASISLINAGPQGPPGVQGPQGPQGESDEEGLMLHLLDPTPHPVYDDMPSLVLIFENHLL